MPVLSFPVALIEDLHTLETRRAFPFDDSAFGTSPMTRLVFSPAHAQASSWGCQGGASRGGVRVGPVKGDVRVGGRGQ